MIVLDASAAIEWLLQTATGGRVEARLFSRRVTLHAPHLLDLEIAQVLRRYVSSGIVTASRGRQALEDLLDLPLARYPHELLLERIWELRNNLTAYDAAYLALAEVLDAPLITCDGKMAAASGHHAVVEVVSIDPNPPI
ncbi:MAG TPA: type II toxin-antitoxin system VapC family toxin [Vicinamibacterales bacterium]|nr:type II toxin-antitoxin system VapC family toxin [Vicinamibacterales bacterium]